MLRAEHKHKTLSLALSYRPKYYFYSERQLALAKPIGQEGVSQVVARNIIKEAARYPGEAIAKTIKRVVETAPELRFTPEHAEIVRMGGQSQASLTEFDPRIKPGQRIDLYTSCITGTVYRKLPWLP